MFPQPTSLEVCIGLVERYCQSSLLYLAGRVSHVSHARVKSIKPHPDT